MRSEKVERMREQILNGPIVKTLLILAYPLIINQLVQVLYNLTDTFWLGKLGRLELSAPGTAWPLVWFFMSIGMGFATAGFAFVSQYVGAKDYDRANRYAGALYSLMLLFATAVGVSGVILAPYLLRLMGVSDTIFPYALRYTRVIFAGIPFSFTLFAFNFLLRAVGDTRTPVKINIGTVLLNLVLDPFFIFGWGPFPQLGVVGAAVATMLSNSLGSLIGGYLLFTGKVGIHLTPETLKPDFHFYSRIFRVGLPSSIGSSTTALGFVILTRVIFTVGRLYGEAHGLPHYEDVAFATYSITNRLTNFMFAFSDGISMAMGTMVGQSIGAGLYERAKKIAEKTMLINFAILSAGTILFAAFRVPIFRFFINDPAIIAESRKVVLYFSASLPFFGIFSAVNNTFNSAGHTKKSMVIGMIRLWGIRLPLSYGLGVLMRDTAGMWLGMGLSNVLGAVIALAWFLRGSWMRAIIEKH
ncbi:sodium-driven multidrug efflux pump protein [Thermococcus kodakarensis KOD1]|uniref:Sodium-driven multidrug efflux pump protein n=1 Tax=Thermococcus kodakarensis (strain ATCC BAA-918 / JCM 12380 / KOD1) TaxID=69014 RepID=Q5JGQ4_THEKO|nr:MATE family efflux transporter [Thermococcus kodakarensis]WCN27280.1 MATE family efflux transporter [Thermococcus kodakarensis]WCN29567.1 MATE family efflux transporter [Thermococcus kodakarensis]BAD85478.1 sodium-driven multidrug efflux pump protein [Thermococcus kodakarensis KOD1]